MTTHEEKAKELVEKFKKHTDCAGDSATSSEAKQIQLEHAKQCAIICVNEILEVVDLSIEKQYYESVLPSITNL